MDKVTGRHKGKNKKNAGNSKPKTTKKRKSEEISRKLALRRRQVDEEAPRNIIQTIIDNITNALPIRMSKKSPTTVASPMRMETLQTLAPELLPNDTLDIPYITRKLNEKDDEGIQPQPNKAASFKMPKMPLVSSEIIKLAVEKKKKEPMQDEAVNTGPDHDVASEIARHVNTLKKISLIAEEFNQKTARNLKEIVDSVQEDLVKKLEEIKQEQHKVEAEKANQPQILEQNICVILEENI